MNLSDIEHFATMVNGCESINNGDRISDNARYAFGVLKLHTVDMGAIAGQEGFLDSIKKGASNVKEWIIKLIKAIKDWLFGNKKEIKEVESEIKELKTKFQKEQTNNKKIENKSDIILNAKTDDYEDNLKDIVVNLEKINDHKFNFLNYKLNLSSIITDVQYAVNAASKSESWELSTALISSGTKLSSEIADINNKLSSWNSSIKEGESASLSDDFNAVFNHLIRANEIITKMTNHLKERMVKQLDKLMA